jgi:hypothetical protein
MFESVWHVLVNVIRWGYMYSGAHTFCMQTMLVTSFGNGSM